MAPAASRHAPIEAIQRRLLAYADAIDTKNWPLLRSCFTPNCDVWYGDLSMPSPEAVVDVMEPAHAGLDFSAHRITNMIVDVDGSTARSRSYLDALLVWRVHPDGPMLKVIGTYDDELSEIDGVWRITKRRFHRQFSEGNDRIIHDFREDV